MAKNKTLNNPYFNYTEFSTIKNGLQNRFTLEYIGVRKQIYNPQFKVVEFDHFKPKASLPNFVLSLLGKVYNSDFNCGESAIIKSQAGLNKLLGNMNLKKLNE